MNKSVRVEVRVNNTIFECALEKGKFYNAAEVTPIAVARIVGVMPDPNPRNEGKFMVPNESTMICENCYKANKGEKGLHFEDPSDLVLPTNDTISKLNLKKN